MYGDAAAFRTNFYHRERLISNPIITPADRDRVYGEDEWDMSPERLDREDIISFVPPNIL